MFYISTSPLLIYVTKHFYRKIFSTFLLLINIDNTVKFTVILVKYSLKSPNTFHLLLLHIKNIYASIWQSLNPIDLNFCVTLYFLVLLEKRFIKQSICTSFSSEVKTLAKIFIRISNDHVD